MQMLSRACFGLPHVREFQWSPAGSVLAYVIPEIGGKPATVVLSTRAERFIHQRRGCRGVSSMKRQLSLRWSPDGRFLAILSVRYAKKKGKNVSYQVSVVRVCERNAPVEVEMGIPWHVDDGSFGDDARACVGAARKPFRSVDEQGGNSQRAFLRGIFGEEWGDGERDDFVV